MEAVGEPVVCGKLSKMEFLVTCSIIKAIMTDDLDWTNSQSLNASEILTVYNLILDLVQTLQLDLALYERTQKDISKLLHNVSFKWDVFKQKSMIHY